MSLDDVGTPWYIVRAAERDRASQWRASTGFLLDVCAEAWSAKAPDYIALPRNGLVEPWSAENWLNPRYHEQAAWMRRASRDAVEHSHTTACLVRAAQDTLYWFRLATSRGTTDFYVGRINFIAPPAGVTLKTKKGERFIAGGEPIKGTDFASALVWYGPDFKAGAVRWRDAATGELIDVQRATELRSSQQGQA